MRNCASEIHLLIQNEYFTYHINMVSQEKFQNNFRYYGKSIYKFICIRISIRSSIVSSTLGTVFLVFWFSNNDDKDQKFQSQHNSFSILKTKHSVS
jgi:hypothetical protein